MPGIFSKFERDGIIDASGDIDVDKLAEKIYEDHMYLRPSPPPSYKRKRTRTERPRKDYKTSLWWKDYVIDADNLFNDPDSRDGKLFRQRFCLDKAHVFEIVGEVRKKGFWSERKDACGRAPCPVELLVLAALRILARNWTYDCCQECTYCSEVVIRTFFGKFVKWFSEDMFPIYVRMPEADEVSINHNGAEYIIAGIPATLASVDCVHVRLWNCAASCRQFATGKEKYPTRGYEVMVNHRKLILSVSIGLYGSNPDDTIIRFDDAMIKIKNGFYKDYKVNIYSKDGNLEVLEGIHTINDNGYKDCIYMMEPTKGGSSKPEERAWSKMVESLRKDVECTFGIVKQVFGILKYGYRGNKGPVLDQVFKTCAALYNMKLINKYGNDVWKEQSDSSGTDPTDDEFTAEEIDSEVAPDVLSLVNQEVAGMSGMGVPPGLHRPIEFVTTADVTAHNIRKQKLITHFYQAMLKREVVWPRNNKRWWAYNPMGEILRYLFPHSS